MSCTTGLQSGYICHGRVICHCQSISIPTAQPICQSLYISFCVMQNCTNRMHTLIAVIVITLNKPQTIYTYPWKGSSRFSKHSQRDISIDQSGIILCMRPANQKWRYTVTPSLIGWAQNDPWWRLPALIILNILGLSMMRSWHGNAFCTTRHLKWPVDSLHERPVLWSFKLLNKHSNCLWFETK